MDNMHVEQRVQLLMTPPTMGSRSRGHTYLRDASTNLTPMGRSIEEIKPIDSTLDIDLSKIYEAINGKDIMFEMTLSDESKSYSKALGDIIDAQVDKQTCDSKINDIIDMMLKEVIFPLMDKELIEVVHNKIAYTSTSTPKILHSTIVYERVMQELNNISLQIFDSEEILERLKHKQAFLNQAWRESVNKWLDEDNGAEPEGDTSTRHLTQVQSRIEAVTKTLASFRDSIRNILVSSYSIPSKVKAENAITLSKIILPPNLGDSPNPVTAQLLVSILRATFHSYPCQQWAIMPVAERMFSEKIGINKMWSPPSLLINYKGIPPKILPYFTQQNKILYELMDNSNYQAVHMTFSQLSTGGDVSDTQSTQATKFDGLAVIAWFLHYHEQSGYQARSKLRDVFMFAYGGFTTGDPVKRVKALRQHIEAAKRLQIQIDYGGSVRRIAETLRRRDPAFVVPMSQWMKCPNKMVELDALGTLDVFLGDVERIARNLTEESRSLTDHHSKMAAANFNAFYGVLTGSSPNKEHEDEKIDQPSTQDVQDKRWICAAHGCKQPVPPDVQSRAQKSRAKGGKIIASLCKQCFTQLLQDKQVKLKTGKIRHLQTRSNHPYKQRALAIESTQDEDSTTIPIDKKLQLALLQCIQQENAPKLGVSSKVDTQPDEQPQDFMTMLATAVATRMESK